MPLVCFVEANGDRISTEAKAGESVMRAAKAAGVAGILGECNGSMSCLTCHCYVVDAGAGPLPPPAPEEQQLLDCLLEQRQNSRLACQIVVTPDREGAVFELPGWQG